MRKPPTLTVYVVLRVHNQRATDDVFLPELLGVFFDEESAYQRYVRGQHGIIDEAQSQYPGVDFLDPAGVPWEQYQNVAEHPDEVVVLTFSFDDFEGFLMGLMLSRHGDKTDA